MNVRNFSALWATVLVALSVCTARADDACCTAQADDTCRTADSGADCCAAGRCDDPCCGEGSGLLGGLIVPSEQCFNDFISPMTNPVFFEDPRTLTEAHAIFINQRIPTLPVTTSTDNLQVYALQLRAALSDRLSIIANKFGYIVSQSPLADDGWADLSAGLKYNLYKDACAQQLLSAGLTFEFPVGATRSLQGNGDGEFNLFLTGMTEFIEDWHWMSAAGFRLPTDTSAESQVFYWSNHIDWQILQRVYLLTEFNWYHWMRSGRRFPLPVEGLDLINLGSVGVAGNDIVTGAIGMKYKPSPATEVGIAYELPLTERRDTLDNRLTVDWIFRY